MTHKLWRRGMKVVEVPIVFTDRFQGHSKMSGHIVKEALWMVWRLWMQHGFRRKPRPRDESEPTQPKADQQNAKKEDKAPQPKADQPNGKKNDKTPKP
jgi:dolichol-phosphate mannosyltransferase